MKLFLKIRHQTLLKTCESFLNEVFVPKLNYEDAIICEGDLNELELLKALKSMQNNKSPGNDGLTKEFYETFWNEIKNPFMNSIMEAREKKKLSTSQSQAVIRLIEKKERDKRLIKNWRPISLLNVDCRIIAKALATRFKETIPKLISFQQTAYVRNRFIGEEGRLISDILEMSESVNLKGYIVTVDIEKAFDSLSHSFLLVCLKKYGYGNDFIKWVEMLLESQESCIINGGNRTKYFKLQKGARQGDPISAYLFILCLEIMFILIKANKRVKGINIFEHTYLYSAYADDTTFFLRDKRSIKELINTFATFSKNSGLKPNHEKCEISGIGVLKSVKVAACGMKCIDLCNDTIKITGIHFSCNKKKRNEKNFLDSITKIQNVLKVWRMRRLTPKGKIIVFKTLAISKIVFLSLISKVPTEIISELERIQKTFLWLSKPKIKNETLCSDFKMVV